MTHLESKFPTLPSCWPCPAACGSCLNLFMVPENTRYLEGIILGVIKSLYHCNLFKFLLSSRGILRKGQSWYVVKVRGEKGRHSLAEDHQWSRRGRKTNVVPHRPCTHSAFRRSSVKAGALSADDTIPGAPGHPPPAH